jgi:hypothetical protein
MEANPFLHDHDHDCEMKMNQQQVSLTHSVEECLFLC